jgi:hypothetical protein
MNDNDLHIGDLCRALASDARIGTQRPRGAKVEGLVGRMAVKSLGWPERVEVRPRP